MKGKAANTKTENSNRTNTVDSQALAVLKQIKNYHPDLSPQARAFLDSRNMLPWKNDSVPRSSFWKQALKQAEMRERCPYTCRHTYASTNLMTRKDPTWLSKQMGHKDWGMIRLIYARWIEDRQLLHPERPVMFYFLSGLQWVLSSLCYKFVLQITVDNALANYLLPLRLKKNTFIQSFVIHEFGYPFFKIAEKTVH